LYSVLLAAGYKSDFFTVIMQVSNNVAGVSFIVLQEMLGMCPVSLWTCDL